MTNCEFCSELKEFKTSRVGKIYPLLDNRILFQTDNFSVIPTIGQLVSPMLMIIPKLHFDRFSEITTSLIIEADEVLTKTIKKINTPVILFEHGAKSVLEKSCGIYHAHIHIVPVNSSFKVADLIGAGYTAAPSLADALTNVRDSSNYVLFRDNTGNYFTNTSEHSSNPEIFSSQYFRRWLASNFAPTKDWNWNNYMFEEELPLAF